MVIKSSKTEDKLSLSETALIAVFRSNEEQQKKDEEKISTLKDTVRGIAEPRATGTALKIITELSESINNGQMNITLTESITPQSTNFVPSENFSEGKLSETTSESLLASFNTLIPSNKVVNKNPNPAVAIPILGKASMAIGSTYCLLAIIKPVTATVPTATFLKSFILIAIKSFLLSIFNF